MFVKLNLNCEQCQPPWCRNGSLFDEGWNQGQSSHASPLSYGFSQGPFWWASLQNDLQLDRWLILWHSTSKICLYKFLFFNKSINFGLGKDNVDNNIYAGYDSWMEYILHIMCEHKLALKQKLESLFCRKCQKFYENIGRQILFPWSTNLFLLKWVDRQIFSCGHHLSFPELAKCVYPNTQKTLCDSLTWKIPSCMEMSKLWAGIRPLCLSLT